MSTQFPSVAKPVKPKTSILAILSLVFALLALPFSCIAGSVGLILGIIALVLINNSNGRLGGKTLAIIGIIGSIALSMVGLLLVAMLFPAVQQVREAARRTVTSNNMREIMLAMHNYESEFQTLPGKQMGTDQPGSNLSWRVHILPQLGYRQLYDSFNLNEPWDSPNNKALIPEMPTQYMSLGGKGDGQLDPGETILLRPVGGGAWPDPRSADFKPMSFSDFVDGISVTAAIVEADASQAVIWTRPDGDYQFDPNDPTRGLGQQRIGVTLVGFVDAALRDFPNNAPPSDFKAIFTIAGHENSAIPAYR